jgi:hypothetical protein
LNASEQPPPGFAYANYLVWYLSGSLKNRDGDEVPGNTSADLIADLNIVA